MPRRVRKLSPRYTVDISFKAQDIAKAGAALSFKIHNRDGLLGTVEIGQGTFGWRGSKMKKGIKRLAWERFAAVMNEQYE